MQNKTIYTKKVKSTKWAGFYDHQTVTRNAHNRKRSHAKTTTKRTDFTALGIMVGISLGCVYLQHFSDSTLNLIYPSASAQEVVHAPQALPEPILEHSEGEALEAEAGQLVATPSATSTSLLIEQAVDEFLPTHKSEALMIMHCLAHRENGHGGNPSAHGDNGLAGGPFQFHQPTWDGYRKLMITEGLATEIGSRYDFKESARTTAWALSTGRSKAWGPILRASQGSNYATCPVPSWDK